MTADQFYDAISKERRLLKNYAMKLTADQDDAQDLIQDTLIKAIRYKDKFVDATNLKGWLCVIMRNTFINNYRRNQRKMEMMNHSTTVLKDQMRSNVQNANAIEEGINTKEIWKVIQTLKEDFKIPFIRFVEGFKYKEISDEMGIPIGTVKSRIFIARKEIIRKLEVLNIAA